MFGQRESLPESLQPPIHEDTMTKLIRLAAQAALLGAALGAPALAQDAAAGEEAFKSCKTCHSIVAPDGTEIQRGGRTGPNLYGVVGRPVASDPDFRYGDSLAALGATGAVWDQASLAAYTADPAAYLKSALGDDGAKSKMSFKLGQGNADVAAYLASVAQ
jgi:cytochrome c